MYIHRLIWLSVFLLSCCHAENNEIIISEHEISRNGHGFCTFELKKNKTIENPFEYTENVCTKKILGRCLKHKYEKRTRNELTVTQNTDYVTKCCDGYTTNSKRDKCVPFCVNDCVNGYCDSPNVCACNEGFEPKLNNSNICTPKCSGCSNGICTAPNVCTCNHGYDWNPQAKECVPFCSGGCDNGKCTSQEKCVCDDGFIHHPTKSTCIPQCHETCVHGVCIERNKCQCDFEYTFANGSTTVCEPICEMSCKNSKCIAPNVCECHDGFMILDDNKPHECHCGQYCVEIDDMCHCLEDNLRVNGTMIQYNFSELCTTSNCINGMCTTPFDCDCNDGYDEVDNVCVPVNETIVEDPNSPSEIDLNPCKCINGICSSNDTCVCVNGFKMSEVHNNICEPQCADDCINGFCNNPDECKCNAGYRFGSDISGSHICHPICNPEAKDGNGCINGTCVAPGTCQCHEGFEISSKESFTCSPIPFYFEEQTSKRNLMIGVASGVSILALVLCIVGFIIKRRSAKNVPYKEAGETSASLRRSSRYQ